MVSTSIIKKLSIPDDTIRFEADILFRRLVDYCINTEFYDIDDKPLINPKNKNSFYNFLLNN